MGALLCDDDPVEEIVNSTCRACLDTGVALTSKGPQPCESCEAAGKQFSEAAVRFRVRLWLVKDQGQAVDEAALRVALLLTHATFERPLQGKLLRAHLRLDERSLKSAVETLRTVLLLPIGSHRHPPYGYFWMRSPDEFNHWLKTMRGQAMTELVTGYRLFKAVYPELAGQESLTFSEDFARDLQEAIK